MDKNKLIIFLTMIGSILIVILPTTIKTYQNHLDRLYEVATKKIEESAEDCFREGVCLGSSVTILELKKYGFLKEDVVNPKTKLAFDDSIVLKQVDFNVVFPKIEQKK